MTLADLDAAERSRSKEHAVVVDHFDEPDKSCFAGYGCTDDCPVSAAYRQPPPRSRAPLESTPRRPFLWWRRRSLERDIRDGLAKVNRCNGPQQPTSVAEHLGLPKARLVAPWFARAGAQSRLVGRIVFGLVVCCVVAFLAAFTVQLCMHMAEGAADSRPAKDIARVIVNDVLSHVQTHLKETR